MKVALNEELDREVYVAFHNTVVDGADFGARIRRDHPGITMGNYTGYIDVYYTKNEDELESVRKDTETCYQEIAGALYSGLGQYFGSSHHENEATCFLSIFDCNPRYLENRTFQTYFRRSHEARGEILAHELTHFAFFDFCKSLGLDESKELWELSELFNIFFLNLPRLQQVLGVEEQLFYPDLANKLESVREIWDVGYPTRDFILKSLHLLQNYVESEA